MRIPLFFLSCLVLLVHSPSGHGQLNALVTVDGQLPRPYIITGTNARGLAVRLPGSESGSMTLALDKITEVKLTPERAWGEALVKRDSGEPLAALETFRTTAGSVRPLLPVAQSDAADYYFAYPTLLASLGKHEDAVNFLNTTPSIAPSGVLARNAVLKAYNLALLGKMDEASAVLASVARPARTSTLFTIYGITNARIQLHKKDFVGAVDDLARITAQRRITSEGFPELQLLLADAYEQLEAAIAAQRIAIEENEVLKSLARINPEEAIKKAGGMTSESAAINAIMSAPPEEFAVVPQSIRTSVVRLWPDSPWAKAALAKLPADAFATDPPPAISGDAAPPADATPQPAAPSKEPEPAPSPQLLAPDTDDVNSAL